MTEIQKRGIDRGIGEASFQTSERGLGVSLSSGSVLWGLCNWLGLWGGELLGLLLEPQDMTVVKEEEALDFRFVAVGGPGLLLTPGFHLHLGCVCYLVPDITDSLKKNDSPAHTQTHTDAQHSPPHT